MSPKCQLVYDHEKNVNLRKQQNKTVSLCVFAQQQLCVASVSALINIQKVSAVWKMTNPFPESCLRAKNIRQHEEHMH